MRRGGIAAAEILPAALKPPYYNRTRWLRRCRLLLLAAWLPLVAAAEEPGLKVEVNRQQLYMGESFILKVTVSGDAVGVEPDLSQLKECTIRPLGSHDISNYSFVFVNGRMLRQGFSGRMYHYEVVPLKAGTLTVGPVAVALDGRRLTAAGPAVVVTDIERQEVVRLTVRASRETVLVDEAFDVTLRVRIQALADPHTATEPLFTDKPPALQAPFLSGEPIAGLSGPDVRQWLQAHVLSGSQQPGLTINDVRLQRDPFDFDSMFGLHGFFDEPRLARFGLDKNRVDRDGRPYWEYTVTLHYTPSEEGAYVFGPVTFKGAVPVEVDARGQAKAANIFAVGPAATVRVIPPPEEGRPLAFTGALGTNLAVTAALDTAVCNAGDPLKLTLTLSGQVRFDKMAPPKLGLQTNLLERFTLYDAATETVKGDQERRYLYTLRPNQAGAYDLPPIEIAYYDTAARAYRTLRTDPIHLQVRPSSEITAAQIVGHTNRPGETRAELAPPDITRSAPPRRTAAGADTVALLGDPALLGMAGVGPACYALALLGQFILAHNAAWQRAARRRRALTVATARLQALNDRSDAGDPRVTASALCEIVRQYMTDRFQCPGAALTPDDLRRLLRAHSLDEAVVDASGALFERHFNAAFDVSSDSESVAKDAVQWQHLLATIQRQSRGQRRFS